MAYVQAYTPPEQQARVVEDYARLSALADAGRRGAQTASPSGEDTAAHPRKLPEFPSPLKKVIDDHGPPAPATMGHVSVCCFFEVHQRPTMCIQPTDMAIVAGAGAGDRR